MDGFEAWAVLEGRSLILVGNEADLVDDPELWAQVWERCRAELLPRWIERNPGRRPEAFHAFDTDDLPAQEQGESETEWLFRCGLIEPDELEAIRTKAKTLAKHNRTRRPDRVGDNYSSPGEIEQFAVAHGLVTPEEAEILTRLETIGWWWKRTPSPPTNGQANHSSNGF